MQGFYWTSLYIQRLRILGFTSFICSVEGACTPQHHSLWKHQATESPVASARKLAALPAYEVLSVLALLRDACGFGV